TEELGIPIFRSPTVFQCNGKHLYVGHGDGLGPGDRRYKVIKKVFSNPVCQWLFQWLHPNVGMAIANKWSGSSRKSSDRTEASFKGDDEWLIQYIRSIEAQHHHDHYIFGHRHLPIDERIDDTHYVNLGDWLKHQRFATFDGSDLHLERYEG
ncbi:MAG: UDP-2,3-diacylglucosamine diphosphatase, partial [Bacteroidota bacterium]